MASDDTPRKPYGMATQHVDLLARSVLTSLRHHPTPDMRQRLSDAAHDLASLSRQSGILEPGALLDQMRGYQLSRADIMDFCIPEAAMIIGQQWHDDDISFWEVSLSSARLYDLVKKISIQWVFPPAANDRPAVLLVQCANQAHVLGPALLCDQFRRAGCSVSCFIADHDSSVAERLNADNYDLVVFSCSTIEVLEKVTQLVKQIRSGACVVPPLVLGGPVMDHAEAIREKTGVDLVTKDIKKALSLCSRSVTPLELKVAE